MLKDTFPVIFKHRVLIQGKVDKFEDDSIVDTNVNRAMEVTY